MNPRIHPQITINFSNDFHQLEKDTGYSKTSTFKLKNEIFQDVLVSFKKTNIDQLGSVLLIFFMSPTLQQFMPVGELTGKNNRFPLLDILGFLKNTHKYPKFGKVRQVPNREFPTKFPGWDLSHSSKFWIFVGIL